MALRIVVLLLLTANCAWGAPPLPPEDPVGTRTLTAGGGASLFAGLRGSMITLVALLAASVLANALLVWRVRRYVAFIRKVADAISVLEQAHAPLHDVALYWAERRARRLTP